MDFSLAFDIAMMTSVALITAALFIIRGILSQCHEFSRKSHESITNFELEALPLMNEMRQGFEFMKVDIDGINNSNNYHLTIHSELNARIKELEEKIDEKSLEAN